MVKKAKSKQARKAIRLPSVTSLEEDNILEEVTPQNLTSIEEDIPAEESPYIEQPLIFRIGLNRVRYTVPHHFAMQSPRWPSPSNSSDPFSSFYSDDKIVDLPEVDNDIGHTLVHYLYTGTYQTLKPRGGSKDATTEYRQAILVYCTSRIYALDDLTERAKRRAYFFDQGLSIFTILDIAREVYPKLLDDELWFKEYLQTKIKAKMEGLSILTILDIARNVYSKQLGDEVWLKDYVRMQIKAAAEADEVVFNQDCFFNRMGEDSAFDKDVVKILMEVYTKKLKSTTKTECSSCDAKESVFENSCSTVVTEELAREAPGEDYIEEDCTQEAPKQYCIEEHAQPECAEPEYTEPDLCSPCISVMDEPISEPEVVWPPPERDDPEDNVFVMPSPSLDSVIDESVVCPSLARHILREDSWKHCGMCLPLMRQVSSQIARGEDLGRPD